MACQMEMVLGALISCGYNLDYRNGTFKKYVGYNDVYAKVIVYLEEIHLMDAWEIRQYLKYKEEQALKNIKGGN